MAHRPCRTWAALAVIALALIATSGCSISFQQSGETPSDIKQRLVSSPIFQSLSDFYPEGMPPGNQIVYPPLDSSTRDRLRARLQSYADGLTKLDADKHEVLSHVFPEKQQRVTAPRISVVDRQTNWVRSTDKTLEIDALVIQAIFRGSLMQAIENDSRSTSNLSRSLPDLKRPAGQRYDPNKQTPEEYQALSKVLEMKRAVENMSASGALGMVLGRSDDSWFALMDYDRAFEPLTVSYTGALLFLMARQQGHRILSHSERLKALNATSEQSARTPGSPYCKARQELEAEADAYALVLLNPSTEGIPSWVAESLGGSTHAGYRSLFFNGFPVEPLAPVEDTCQAMSNLKRVNALNSLDRAIKQQADRRFNELILDVLEN